MHLEADKKSRLKNPMNSCQRIFRHVLGYGKRQFNEYLSPFGVLWPLGTYGLI